MVQRLGEGVARESKCIHQVPHPGANRQSTSHRCHLFEVAFVWVLTKETIHLPLGCLQGGCFLEAIPAPALAGGADCHLEDPLSLAQARH